MDSCNANGGYYACQNAARGTNIADGYIGSITNSCNDGRACINVAYGGYIGFIKDSCNATRACENLAAELPQRKLEEEVDFKDARDSWREAKTVCEQDGEAKLNDCWKDWCIDNTSYCDIWCANEKKAETKRCQTRDEVTWGSVKGDCQGRKAECFDQWCTDNPYNCDAWCLRDSNVSKDRCTNRITGPGPMSSPPSRSPTSAPTSASTSAPLSCVNGCCNAVSACDNIALTEIADETCQPCEVSENESSESEGSGLFD